MREKKTVRDLSLHTKIALTLVTTSFIIFTVNLFMYISINSMVRRLDQVYQGNLERAGFPGIGGGTGRYGGK